MASVLDLGSCCLVGYSFSARMTTSLIEDAITKAIESEKPKAGLLFHSDQGSQYCSHRFQELLSRNDICGSISARGQYWDTAPAESFWAILK